MILSNITPVAQFDFHIDGILESVMNFSESRSLDFPLSFEIIGYGYNSIINMGSNFLVNMVQNVMVVILIVLLIMGCNDGKEYKWTSQILL